MQTKKIIFYPLFFLLVFSFILTDKVIACDNCGGRNPGDEWCENGKKYRCVACGPDCRIPGTNIYTCCKNDKPEWDSTCTQGAGKDKFTLELGPCGGGGGGSERVVGRVTTGNCQFLTGLLITSSDGKVAGWDYNEDPICGTWSPHYQIGRWAPGTQVMITLTPPTGYTCSQWTFDSKPNETGGETNGQGCVAIITIGQGNYSPDWQNHLWFHLTQCQNECSSQGQVERRCSGTYVQKRTCGNYDNDPCLEWSNWENEQNCAAQGKVCQNGQCITQTCSRDADCPTGYFCEYPVGTCNPPGTCVPVPDVCPMVYDPVCGCNNQTYSNDCVRATYRVSKKHHGECIVCQPINAYVEPNPVTENNLIVFIFTSNRGYTTTTLNVSGGVTDCHLDLTNSAKCGNNPKDSYNCWWKWTCRATTPGSYTATFHNAENCPKSVNFTVMSACQNECSAGTVEYRCSGNYLQKRTCGNYDSDPCTEWSAWENVENCSAKGGYCSSSFVKCVLPPAVITKGVVVTY